MARYGKHGEQTYRQNFNRKKKDCIDWLLLNLSLARRVLEMDGLLAIAIAPCYISKAGKKTPHIGRFWSGCAGAVKHGLEIMGIGLLDVANNIYNVDSLVVRGSINDTDIHTLWEASFKGRLSIINLENAEIENGIIPEDAFWHQKEQLDPSWEFINTIHLRRIILPYGVKRIEEGAFSDCDSLEQIIFPATLNLLGQECCSYMPGLKRIYCMASEPHVCEESTLNPGNSPFGKYNSDFYLRTPNDIPIYVPIGAAEKYRNAWGWDYFTNFIETDDFPTSIHNVTTEHYDSKNCVYDLMGRKVINPQKGQVYIKNGKKTLFAY